MATIFDLSENTAPDGTDRLYITDGTNDEGVQIANLLKGSGAEVPAAKITGTVAHERGGLEADVSGYDGLVRISGGSTSNLKSNFSASSAPAVTDDSASGYVVGSRWIDTTNDAEYVCVDNTASAAVWVQTAGGGGGGGGYGLWFPVTVPVYNNSIGWTAGTVTESSSYSYVRLRETSNSRVHIHGAIPSGVTSIDSFTLVCSSSSVAEMLFNVNIFFRANGEAYATHTAYPTGSGYPDTTGWYTGAGADYSQHIDLVSFLSSMAAGDDFNVVCQYISGSWEARIYGIYAEVS